MTFSTEKQKQATDRFMLVRMSLTKSLDGVVSDLGASVWGATFDPPLIVDSVFRSGNAMTLVDGTPDEGEYSYDESTGVFQANLGFEGTPIYLMLNHTLYLTSKATGVVAREDPTLTTGTKRFWEPRIARDEEFRESVKNAFAGIFTIDESSIELKNTDRWVQSFFGPNDSVRDKDVKVWFCLNSVSNIHRVFTGKSRAIKFNSGTLSVEIYDSFSRLDQSAYFGDLADEAIYLKTGVTFSGVDPRKHGEPCRLIAGKFSRFRTKPGRTLPFSTLDGQASLDPQGMFEAACIDYTANVQTYTNRTWAICRTLHGLRNIVVGARSSVANSGSITTLSFLNATWATMDLEIGDTIMIGSNYARAVDIVQGGSTVAVFFQTNSVTTPSHTTATAITVHPAIEIAITDATGETYYAQYGRDYTVTTEDTFGGNKFHYIEFGVAFEQVTYSTSDWFGEDIAAGLDPGRHGIFYKVRPDTTDLAHGKFLQKLCTVAGLDVDSASFDAADVAFEANVLMSIPWFDQTDYGSYLDCAQAVLESTLGYISVNDAAEAVYELVGAVSTEGTRDSSVVRRDSVVVSVDYNDLLTEIVSYNPHDYSDENSVGDSSYTVSSPLAFFLHGVIRSTQLRHYLDRISARLPTIVAVRSRPVITYSWTTETEDLDTSIADDLTLESDEVLGAVGSVDVKVIGLRKSTSGVNVTAVQIQGV